MSRTKRKYPEDYKPLNDPKAGRDRKPFWKPGKAFKKCERSGERAAEKIAVAKGEDPPITKKSDTWNFN